MAAVAGRQLDPGRRRDRPRLALQIVEHVLVFGGEDDEAAVVELRMAGDELPLPGGQLAAGRLLLRTDPEAGPAALLLVGIELGRQPFHRPS